MVVKLFALLLFYPMLIIGTCLKGLFVYPAYSTLLNLLLWFQGGGKTDVCIQALEEDNISEWEDLYAHRDKKTWKVDCTREMAEDMLTGKPEGTFLMRPASAGQALSIVYDDTVYHCLIIKTEVGYGFAEPYDVFQNLDELVLHYAVNSLDMHNRLLRTSLKYPVNTHLVKKPKDN